MPTRLNLIGRVLTQGRAESSDNPSGSNLEVATLVPSTTGNANTGATYAPENHETIIPTHSINQPYMTPQLAAWSVSGIDSAVKKLSEEATRLLLSSWRQKTNKSYDSLFKKWLCWCDQRDIDPVSEDITGVVNFLAHLFEEGYQ